VWDQSSACNTTSCRTADGTRGTLERQAERQAGQQSGKAPRHCRCVTRTEAAAADIRAASNNAAVDAFAADLSSQTELQRLAGEVLERVPALGRAGQQRRRVQDAPARHRRRPGAHVRAQSPRRLPPHWAAAGSAQRPAHRPASSRCLPSHMRRAASTSTTCRVSRRTRGSRPTTARSWPT
jgi:hypothetical protein